MNSFFKIERSDIKNRRFVQSFILGLVWAPFCLSALQKLPPLDLPLRLFRALIFVPLFLRDLATNRSMRERIRKSWRQYKRYDNLQRIKSSRMITRYEHGEYAECNCLGCRVAKASIRRFLQKNLLKAYCLKCKRQVDIKNPEEVILKGNRKAIRGTCPICCTTVFRTGKFYGSTLFKS